MRWSWERRRSKPGSQGAATAPVPLKVVACGKEFSLCVDANTSLRSLRLGVAEMAAPGAAHGGVVSSLFVGDKQIKDDGDVTVGGLPRGAVVHLHFAATERRASRSESPPGVAAPTAASHHHHHPPLQLYSVPLVRMVGNPLSAPLAMVSPELAQHNNNNSNNNNNNGGGGHLGAAHGVAPFVVPFSSTPLSAPSMRTLSPVVQPSSFLLPREETAAASSSSPTFSLDVNTTPQSKGVLRADCCSDSPQVSCARDVDNNNNDNNNKAKALAEDYVVLIVDQTDTIIPETSDCRIGGGRGDASAAAAAADSSFSSFLSLQRTASYRQLRVNRGYPVGTLRELFSVHLSQRIFMGNTPITDERLTFEELRVEPLQHFSFRTEPSATTKTRTNKRNSNGTLAKTTSSKESSPPDEATPLAACGGEVSDSKREEARTGRAGLATNEDDNCEASKKRRPQDSFVTDTPVNRVQGGAGDVRDRGSEALRPLRLFPALPSRRDGADDMSPKQQQKHSSSHSLRGYKRGEEEEKEMVAAAQFAKSGLLRSSSLSSSSLRRRPSSSRRLPRCTRNEWEEIYPCPLPTPPSPCLPTLVLPPLGANDARSNATATVGGGGGDGVPSTTTINNDDNNNININNGSEEADELASPPMRLVSILSKRSLLRRGSSHASLQQNYHHHQKSTASAWPSDIIKAAMPLRITVVDPREPDRYHYNVRVDPDSPVSLLRRWMCRRPEDRQWRWGIRCGKKLLSGTDGISFTEATGGRNDCVFSLVRKRRGKLFHNVTAS